MGRAAGDDRVTAPLHGFASAADYYRRSSARQYLPGIRVPTLILHALDDPFLFPQAAPRANEVPGSVALEVYPRGGHVGFVAGPWPWAASYWLERRIPAFIAGHCPGAAHPGRIELAHGEPRGGRNARGARAPLPRTPQVRGRLARRRPPPDPPPSC